MLGIIYFYCWVKLQTSDGMLCYSPFLSPQLISYWRAVDRWGMGQKEEKILKKSGIFSVDLSVWWGGGLETCDTKA